MGMAVWEGKGRLAIRSLSEKRVLDKLSVRSNDPHYLRIFDAMKSSGPLAIFLAIASISRPCSTFFDLNPLTWLDRGPIFGKANLQKMGFSFEDHQPPKISRGINGGNT